MRLSRGGQRVGIKCTFFRNIEKRIAAGRRRNGKRMCRLFSIVRQAGKRGEGARRKRWRFHKVYISTNVLILEGICSPAAGNGTQNLRIRRICAVKTRNQPCEGRFFRKKLGSIPDSLGGEYAIIFLSFFNLAPYNIQELLGLYTDCL